MILNNFETRFKQHITIDTLLNPLIIQSKMKPTNLFNIEIHFIFKFCNFLLYSCVECYKVSMYLGWLTISMSSADPIYPNPKSLPIIKHQGRMEKISSVCSSMHFRSEHTCIQWIPQLQGLQIRQFHRTTASYKDIFY